jgi:cytoskeletal protein CcmA (bactofilin family)
MIKKIILFSLAGLILFLLPSYSQAAEHRAGDRIVVGEEEVVNDNLYVAAGELVVDGTINGDLFVGAGFVEVNGRVTGDLLVFSGELSIKGQIDGDVRVASGSTELSGRVGGEMIFATSLFELDKDGQVVGNLTGTASKMILHGSIGEVKTRVGKLEIKPSATINGDLNYYSMNRAEISNEASIAGDTGFNQIEKASYYKEVDFPAKVYSLLSLIAMGLLLVYLFPKNALRGANSWRTKSLVNFIWGLLTLVVVPGLAFIIALSLIGMPLSFGLMMIYIISIYLGTIVGVVGLGYCIQKYFSKKTVSLNWLSVIIGALVYYLLGLIPFIGGLVAFVISIIGLGVVVSRGYSFISRRKSAKAL